MTKQERYNSAMGECSMAAEDCKGSADYAAYAFKQLDETKAREYFRNLVENLSRLKGAMASLDYVKRNVAEDGLDTHGTGEF